jgi:hypothetical protein
VALVCSGVLGACGGLTGDKKDHVEVSDQQCVVCHRDEYAATTKPPHQEVQFPETCGDCHTETAWSPAKFVHPFPLVGAHAAAGCKSCHGDPPKYDGLATDCVGCHKADYDSSPYPGHQTFPTTCDDCHNTLAWKPASPVAHPFPLTGAHAVIACESCHINNVFQGTPKECVGCHLEEYNSSPQFGHQSFPKTCQDCHSTFAWKPATEFKHPWPLLGAHSKLACEGCHVGNPPKFAGTSPECVSCHKADFDGAVATGGHQNTITVCETCHNTHAWKPAAQFQHPFPLTGAHTGTPCASCHVGNPPVYKGTPQDCVGCHQADYDASPYPGHQTFPTTCTSCHTTSAWKPASGTGHPESSFPITSGAHKNYACNECHNQSLGANGKGNADCVGCHTGAHTRSKMDNKHSGVKNYPKGTAPPNFCLDCHPKGKH